MMVEDQVSKDLVVNVTMLQQDFSAKGLYNTLMGRIPWLDDMLGSGIYTSHGTIQLLKYLDDGALA